MERDDMVDLSGPRKSQKRVHILGHKDIIKLLIHQVTSLPPKLTKHLIIGNVKHDQIYTLHKHIYHKNFYTSICYHSTGF